MCCSGVHIFFSAGLSSLSAVRLSTSAAQMPENDSPPAFEIYILEEGTHKVSLRGCIREVLVTVSQRCMVMLWCPATIRVYVVDKNQAKIQEAEGRSNVKK